MKKEAVVLTKAQKKKLRERKNKIIKQIKDKKDGGEEISSDETTDLAQKWMEIADVDGNGTIDKAEFVDMISKLESNV